MISDYDVKQIEEHGLSLKKVYEQIETFSSGIPSVNIITAASIGNGIEVISENDRQKLIDLYESRKVDLDLVKFVPASGAATRMFQFLFKFLEEYDPNVETFNKFIKRQESPEVSLFFNSLDEFAFVNDARKVIRKKFPNYKQSKKGSRYISFIKAIMNEEGLNFANLPKGLIPFHKYTKFYTTAFEEQLYETAFYGISKSDAYLHFTFAERHIPYFKAEAVQIIKRVSKQTKVNFHISYSSQNKSTDTIAVDENSKPLRDQDGKLVFRPSGHGALLDNLNDVNADIIFIKNIDNVVVKEFVEEVANYKKILAGKLLWVQRKVFNYLEILDEDRINDEIIKEIKSFLWNELNIKEASEEPLTLMQILNRPIRVCGVVKNTGAPGGGPFWVRSESGHTSLQIVEMAQIDKKNQRHLSIVTDATHFNPVDIVCGVRDFKGKKFDLFKYSDPSTGIISMKSYQGEPLKALELPGLWNGGMANWNTVLVEVPLSTFNPVKTVNDLLHKEHRPNA